MAEHPCPHGRVSWRNCPHCIGMNEAHTPAPKIDIDINDHPTGSRVKDLAQAYRTQRINWVSVASRGGTDAAVISAQADMILAADALAAECLTVSGIIYETGDDDGQT